MKDGFFWCATWSWALGRGYLPPRFVGWILLVPLCNCVYHKRHSCPLVWLSRSPPMISCMLFSVPMKPVSPLFKNKTSVPVDQVSTRSLFLVTSFSVLAWTWKRQPQPNNMGSPTQLCGQYPHLLKGSFWYQSCKFQSFHYHRKETIGRTSMPTRIRPKVAQFFYSSEEFFFSPAGVNCGNTFLFTCIFFFNAEPSYSEIGSNWCSLHCVSISFPWWYASKLDVVSCHFPVDMMFT